MFVVLFSVHYFVLGIFFPGVEKPPSDLVDLLVHSNLYDMAFTVILKFWRGSRLKR